MAVRSFYSKRRRDHVLELFQNGRVRDLQMTLPSPVDDGQNGGKGYILRRQSVFRAGQTGLWNESSEDEYDPDAKPKRRSMGVGGNGAKPLKRQRLNQGIAAKAQHEATVEQGGRIPSLVTFKFVKDRSKAALRDLADRHGNGYKAITGKGASVVEETSILQEILPHNRDMQFQDMRGPTYLEKMDQESANIDNVDGRVLRSRKILIREDFDTPVQKTYACSPVEIAPNTITEIAPDTLTEIAPDTPTEIAPDTPTEIEPAISVSKSEAPLERTQHTIPPGERPAIASVPTAVEIIRSSVTTPQYPLIRQVGSSMMDPIILDESPPGSPVMSGPAGTLKQITNSGTNAIILDKSQSRAPASSGPAAALKQITTCWAHPIDFHHIRANASDCDFCQDIRFGIYGHGRITIDVIQLPGSAWQETGNGHRSTGKPATRMCVACSLIRLSISRCKVHRFEDMRVPRTEKHHERYMQHILAKEWHPVLAANVYETCSVCPRLACWHCCVDKQYDVSLRPVTDGTGKGKGCGLKLCDTCTTKVMSCGGRLRKDSIMQAGPKGLRADVEFLFTDSLLHQAYGQYQQL
ncbi:hypothetical protein LTR46_010334 [Exophiala xenobiotica]|nr:hypothetical protein LTR46_010334 [Exophiala xenobiotica]